MRAVSVVLLTVAISVRCEDRRLTYDLRNAPQIYSDFIKVYKKKIDTNEEFHHRLDIFKKTLQKVNMINSNPKAVPVQLNEFADREFSEVDAVTPSDANVDIELVAAYAMQHRSIDYDNRYDNPED